MHTDDLPTMDEEGDVNIVGRLKDMAIRGGENVCPREVEAFLCRHPKAQDVQVIGAPDPALRALRRRVPDDHYGREPEAVMREQTIKALELKEQKTA